MIQVTKVWWDGEKLMAKPIDPTTIYQEPLQREPDFWEGYQPEPTKPAPVQEPVAWPMQEQPDGTVIPVDPSELPSDYFTTTPPAAQRQWVGLTDEELKDIELGCHKTLFGKIEAMQKVEAKLKEKNCADH
jgi:hypothetical protein